MYPLLSEEGINSFTMSDSDSLVKAMLLLLTQQLEKLN